MKNDKQTVADVRAEIERAVRTIDQTGIHDLSHLVADLRRKAEEAGLGLQRLPLALTQRSCAPNTPVLVAARTQLPLRLCHLIVAPHVAEGFELLDVRMGNNSMLPTWGSVGLEVFDVRHQQMMKTIDLAPIMEWKMDKILEPGMEFGLLVQNLTTLTADFTAIFWSEVVRPRLPALPIER